MLKYSLKYSKPTRFKISMEKVIRFFLVGHFLHLFFILGMVIFMFGYWGFDSNEILSKHFLNGFFMVFGLGLSVFAGADSRGRYQNYKQIKDALYNRGFDNRLIRPFMYSKCQRDAVLVAARDLKFENEVKTFFYENGYRWYHVLPDAFTKNPFVLFKAQFWSTILLTKRYQIKYFYW